MRLDHSNDYCIIHFNFCQHSRIALEQLSVEILHVIFQLPKICPSCWLVAYIPDVGHVPLTGLASTVYISISVLLGNIVTALRFMSSR